MQQTSNRRQLNGAAAQAIARKRKLVRLTDVGELVKFYVQGNGNIIPVKDKNGNAVDSAANPGQPLMKRIYNVKANSQVAMLNERNKEILTAAIMAEREQDFDAAHEAYNDYLNKIQISFGVLLPSKAEFHDGQLIEGIVTLVETENGSLLTIENPCAVKSTMAADSPAFTLAGLLGVESLEDVFSPKKEEDAKAGA